MPHRRWDERLDDELARRGVPVRFRRRLLAELRDHAEDLREEEGLTMTDDLLDERLGRPAELAARAAGDYRRSTWVARHPFWVFALLPLPAALAVSVAALLLGFLGLLGVQPVVWLFAYPSGELPRWAVVGATYGLVWFVGIVPPVLLAAFFSRLYVRHSVSLRWFVTAAAQVLLFVGSLLSIFHQSDQPGQSRYMLEFAFVPRPTTGGWGLPLLHEVGWMQLIQVLATVAVGGLISAPGDAGARSWMLLGCLDDTRSSWRRHEAFPPLLLRTGRGRPDPTASPGTWITTRRGSARRSSPGTALVSMNWMSSMSSTSFSR